MKDTIYDHYIAIDWAIKNMAIARMTKKSNKITVIDVPADLAELQAYLKTLEGSKILAIEETGTSQWLYTELKGCVDTILICDPHRNKLLNEGAQNDKIDASKLVQLLRAGLMKEVYHSGENFLYLRRLISGYDDLVQSGVRVKNQRYNLLRACGKNGDEKGKIKLERPGERFVLESQNRRIKVYEEEKKGYEKTFATLVKKYKEIRNQKSLPGIGNILAVKIVAIIVTPYRFPDIGHYKSYAGLIKLEKISGGRVYSKKNPRYSRALKSVYKTAISAAIGGNNPINDYYEYLMREKNYPEHNARHQACRKLATLSLGVFKSGKRYTPFRSDHVKGKKESSSGL
jgi:transposase